MAAGIAMPGAARSAGAAFTLAHGFTVSLALHAAVALPFLLRPLLPPAKAPSVLVVELDGASSDRQAEQKVLRQMPAAPQDDTPAQAAPAQPPAPQAPPPAAVDQRADVAMDQSEAPAPAPAPPPPTPPVEALPPADAPAPPQTAAAAPAAASAGAAGAQMVPGEDEQQDARTLKARQDSEVNRLRDYVKLLTRKVQSHLIYPDELRKAGLQGVATVSFAILPTGDIRPETLKVVAGSGQRALDASALKTVRSSVPFDPPPKEMTVTLTVAFGRKP